MRRTHLLNTYMKDNNSVAAMVSYYNPLAMYRQPQQQVGTQHQISHQHAQQHVQAHHQQAAAAAAAVVAVGAVEGAQSLWYGYPHAHPHGAHHQPNSNQQYLEHPNVLGWPAHPHAHHYSHNLQYQHHQAAYQHHQQQQLHHAQVTGIIEWSGDEENNPGVGAGEPSPPITVSGSEVSSPRTPSSPPVNNNSVTARNNNRSNGTSGSTTPSRPTQIRSPYEWMKKPSYQNQPNPGLSLFFFFF